MASGADVGGLYGSGHGRGLRQSSGVIAPELATLGPSALAVTAAVAAATTSTVSAVASAGGGGGGSGWDGGAVAKSFKRLSGILMPGVASRGGTPSEAAGSRRNSLDAQRNGDAGGAGAAGEGTGGGGGGGGGGGVVRFLKRMVSGKRRSTDRPMLPGWSSSTSGGAGGVSPGTAPALGVIGTVDEGMEGAVELPPPSSSYGEGGLG